MIIQIRGTSGSGKTTVMRKVMEGLGTWQPAFRPERSRPEYYSLTGPHPRPSVVVLGSYEATCGGCDNIGSAPDVYKLTMSLLDPDPSRIILQEGLLLSEDTKWTVQMPEVRCLFLTTEIDRCLRQIEGRRKEAGNTKPLNPANTQNRVRTIERARVKLTEAGVYCRRASPEQAPGIVLRWIQEAQSVS